MSSILNAVPLDLIKPSYNIYHYTGGMYKIVHFKTTVRGMHFSNKAKEHHDTKLDASISRARRVVLELALCNEWEYFCTFTISKDKFDRTDLAAWNKKFKQWLRDQRKKYGRPFRFVLVPEQHEDGAWHMHGLFDSSPVLVSFRELLDSGENVPYKLVKNGYYNWIDYQKKFGFCSFSKIKDKTAVSFYIVKYISKSLAESCMPVGMSLYSASDGLNRATFHGDIYGESAYLNQFLQNHYDFCDTGFTRVKDDLPWHFAMEYMDYEAMESFDVSSAEECPEVDAYYETVQEVMEGF